MNIFIRKDKYLTFFNRTSAPSFGQSNTQSFGTASAGNQFSFGSNTPQQNTGFQLNLNANKPTGAVAPQQSGFNVAPNVTVTTSGSTFPLFHKAIFM